MKEILSEAPKRVTVSKTQRNWVVTVNLNIEEVDDGFTCDSYSVVVNHKPEHEDVLSAVIEAINHKTDTKILSGYVWNGKPVWLSSENQFNFKAAYDVAVQTNGSALPIKFKLGEDAEGLPMYHTFNSMNAFTDFYTGAISFIQQTLAAGWEEKDAARDWVNQLYKNE